MARCTEMKRLQDLAGSALKLPAGLPGFPGRRSQICRPPD
jgi:hypothetical protein